MSALPVDGRGGRSTPMYVAPYPPCLLLCNILSRYSSKAISPRGMPAQVANVRLRSPMLPALGAQSEAKGIALIEDRSAFSAGSGEPASMPPQSCPRPPKKSVSFSVPDDLFSEVDCAAALLMHEASSSSGLGDDEHDYARTLAGSLSCL